MAEMAERAQQISQEAGTKITAAMKDVIGAAAGLAGFAVESARDLVQYMVRRGQMTQDEADKLIREAEDAHNRRAGRAGTAKSVAVERPKSEKVVESTKREPPKPVATAAKRSSGSVAVMKSEKKPAAKREAAPKKPAAKSTTPKKKR